MPTNSDFVRDLQKITRILEKYKEHREIAPSMMNYHIQQMRDHAKQHIQRQPTPNNTIPPTQRSPQQDPALERLLHSAKNAYHCLRPEQHAFLHELECAAYDATGYKNMSISDINYMRDQKLITRVTVYSTNANPYRLTSIGRATLNHV